MVTGALAEPMAISGNPPGAIISVIVTEPCDGGAGCAACGAGVDGAAAGGCAGAGVDGVLAGGCAGVAGGDVVEDGACACAAPEKFSAKAPSRAVASASVTLP